MNTDHLRLFLAIAKHRALSRAAAELELGQATVSERLKALEGEVGTPLFERRGRGVVLSAAGEAFKPYAERALDVLRQAADAAHTASRGHGGLVTIAVTVTSGAYLFAPALVAFQKQFPQVQVRVRSAHSWDAPGLILDGVAQLALISGTPTATAIESVATFTSPLTLAAGKAHPATKRGARYTLAQLAQEQLLVSYWGPGSELFLARVRAAGDNKTGLWLELSPVELVKGMLIAGTGISLLPEIAIRRELAAGELARVHLAEGNGRLPKWEITLIRHSRRRADPAADALAQTLTKHLPKLAR